jgi:hypothetical protein
MRRTPTGWDELEASVCRMARDDSQNNGGAQAPSAVAKRRR